MRYRSPIATPGMQTKARPGFPERAHGRLCGGGLTLGVDSFLQLALFFLFLFLELLAYEFKNRHFRSVAHADSRVNNSRVAAGA
ncbi:MAG: hypothetical protein WB607_19025, partial [Candidatus Acidiferrum sp.]